MENTWWYCLTHKAVEPYEGCKADDRLGPYPSRQDAEQALERAAARNEEWENDPKFNDPVEDEDDDTEGWGPFKH